jgi:hypothetical protein
LIRIIGYHRKIIPKRNIFTETRTQDSFQFCDLSRCNLLAKTNNFVLGAVLLSCLVSELQKPSSPGLEPRTVFGVVAVVSVISSSYLIFVEVNNFVLCDVLLSCTDSKIQKPTSPGLEPRTVFGVLIFLQYLPGYKEQACQGWFKSIYPFSIYK